MSDNRIKTVCIILIMLGVVSLLGACSQIRQYTLWGSTSSENGVYKIGNPYQVMGTWYYPEENYDYEEIGVASWYGPDFHNGVTANGEVYDMHLMTAAHRTLPLPSIVRVTNLENGRSVVLRVNDRGPFVNNRIIDVSKLAAEKLDFHEQGTTRVKVEILAEESKELKKAMLAGDVGAQTAYTEDGKGLKKKQIVRSLNAPRKPAANNTDDGLQVATIKSLTTEPVEMVDEVAERSEPLPKESAEVKPEAKIAPNPSGSGLYVQVGAFSSMSNAQTFMDSIAKYGNAKISTTKINGKDIHRVRMGAFTSGKEALEMLDKMRALGYNDARIVEETVLTKGW